MEQWIAVDEQDTTARIASRTFFNGNYLLVR
jgi:hypothetical protein